MLNHNHVNVNLNITVNQYQQWGSPECQIFSTVALTPICHHTKLVNAFSPCMETQLHLRGCWCQCWPPARTVEVSASQNQSDMI